MTPEEIASEFTPPATPSRDALIWRIKTAIRDAVAEEREACARAVENTQVYGGSFVLTLKDAADAIRSRANEKEKTG